ncbi:hypothetical protein RNZ50_20015 [Paracoccaceae bacterium Fryx2]|nr:hypothetical protein [Paracoccaceae bacterium Fryx2]
MTDLVTDVLRLPEVARIAFGFGSVLIGPTSFPLVVNALAASKISIVTVTGGGNRAVYNYKRNRFTFSFTVALGDPDREALVVHESVHAAFDVMISPMQVKVSEAAAYIAQCQFFYFRNQAAIDAGAAPTFGDPILAAAWPVSQLALTRPRLDEADVAALLSTISGHRIYRLRHSEIDEYDGV